MDAEQNTIAIIGAGMAGLACATELARAGWRPVLFDKGRGPGGRMATRRAEIGGRTLRFDHGAQYFTARDPAFQRRVAEWAQAGIVARWPAAGQEAWVGTPSMNAPIRYMAEALDVRWNTRILAIEHAGHGWRLDDGETVHEASHFACAIPAEQAAELLAGIAPELAGIAAEIRSEPCWAVMAAFDVPLHIAADTFRSEEGPVSWAARNSAKPGRDGAETWVIHASPARTRELLDQPGDEVAQLLLADFFAASGAASAEPRYLAAHRWLYAMPDPQRGGHGAVWDADRRIGIAGDYLTSPRVEGAFLSGRALARAVAQR